MDSPRLTTSNIRPNHEGQESATAEHLVRQAHEVLTEHNITMGKSKVSKLVRTFKRQAEPKGLDFAAWLLDQCDARRVIGYRDPTGNDAARNVDRRGRSR